MIHQGIICELPQNKDTSSHNVGRKPINIDFVLTSRLALGVSMGREKTHYCLTDLRGGILAQGSCAVMPDSYDEMRDQLGQLLLQLRSQYASDWDNLVGIGITVPGLVDTSAGVIKNLGSERLDWCDKPLAEDVSRAIGLPVCLENNVRGRTKALPLFRPHLVRDYDNFAFCHVSWGIACPVMLPSGAMTVGEIGHTIIDPAGPQIKNCGMPGSLESYSSVRAILERCRQALRRQEAPVLASICNDPSRLTLEHILEAQGLQDPAVCTIVNLAMWYVGISLANIANLLDPHLLFLSGPMFRRKESAFQIGLTATPDKRNFAYFNQNVVSEYPGEQAIIDGVNVGEDVFLIETEVSKQGGTILKNRIPERSKIFARECRIATDY